MNENKHHRDARCLGAPNSKATAFKRWLRDERGVAVTEFALVLPLLMLLLFGMLDFGKAFNYWLDETDIANQGARFAAVNNNPGASASLTLQNYLRASADTKELELGSGFSTLGALKICVSFPNTTSNVGDPVDVEAKTTYQFLPFISRKVFGVNLFQWTLSSSATMRIEQAPTNYSPANNHAGC